MENNEDKMLKDFFSENKTEIEDRGFSKSVMHRLPAKKQQKTGWIVPAFAVLGTLIALLTTNVTELVLEVFVFISHLPYYYLMGAVMALPIVFLFVYLYWEKRHYELRF